MGPADGMKRGSLTSNSPSLGRALSLLPLLGALLLWCGPVRASPVTLHESYAGNLNYVVTGGTLRADDNGGDPCDLNASSTAALSGIPGGATIEAAFLYWAGSGATADNAVTFASSARTADRTYSETYVSGSTHNFFGGVDDVSDVITGNGNYTFTDLTVSTGTPYSGTATCLAGWALVVIYSEPGEDFRVINLFEGLAQFRFSNIVLTPSNFQVPVSPINGKFSVVTWEGDPDINGAGEFVEFNGTELTDAANPDSQQFNSTINTIDNNTDKYGVDIDTYDISAELTAGDTSATTEYSADGDRVLLMVEVISVTNVPVADLSINKSHSGDFTYGVNGTYTINVTNDGPSDHIGTITVTDTLPAGLTYVSATGTGWTCNHSLGTVTCTSSTALADGATSTDITLTVAVGGAAIPSVTNTASVDGALFDNHSGNDSDSDLTTVLGPNFSTSTKTVQDLSGGDVLVGDTLRYTITVNNSGQLAGSATVEDDIPDLVNSFTVVSIPGGATDSSTGFGTGANGTGFLDVSGISVAAGGSATVVFDVTVDGSAQPGDTIDNSAVVLPAAGPGATPAATTLTVNPSGVPTSGNKRLYVYNSDSGDAGADFDMSRSQPGSGTGVAIVEGNNRVWTLTPTAQANITISGTVSVQLVLTETGNGSDRVIRVELADNSGTPNTNYIHTTRTITLSGTPTAYTFNLTSTAGSGLPATLLSGRSYRLRVLNQTTGSGSRDIDVYPFDSGTYSYVQLPATTVINVDSVVARDAPYNGGVTPAWFEPGETVYLRAVVSDPFGSFDITSATIDITDPNSNLVINDGAMSEVNDSGVATKTYEYAYVVPASGPAGYWNVAVTANEGTEGTVSHTNAANFLVVLQPSLTLVKSSTARQDPVNDVTNPKRIPGARVRYAVLLTNSGLGSPDPNTVVLTDVVPANTMLCVTSACAEGGDPVEFVQGTPTSGLSYTYASHVTYSCELGGGAPYTCTPDPDGDGYDPDITGIRVQPAGTLAASSGSPPHPSFTVRFHVRIR